MRRRGSLRGRVAGVVLVCAALVSGACSAESTTTEMADDPADVTVPGPPPTAPPDDESSGLSAGGDELLAELEALTAESDLCRVLSGEAFAQLLDQEFNAAGLVTSPAGVTQLVALVDGTFTHLVTIAPPQVQPAMQTVKDVWTRLSRLNSGAPDAEEQALAIASDPQLAAANESLVLWAAANCPDAAQSLVPDA